MILDVLDYVARCLGYMALALCALFTVVGSLAEFRQWRERRADQGDAEDADYDALRTPTMGDLRSVPEQGIGDVWHRPYEYTAVYDQLAAERPEVAARIEATALDDDAAIREWIRGAWG